MIPKEILKKVKRLEITTRGMVSGRLPGTRKRLPLTTPLDPKLPVFPEKHGNGLRGLANTREKV